ncbi:NKAP family protein CG6066-like [Clytia hemisphaerica]|uniref:NKAP family protein CG6066-like n=1 Tax=Clytia hemisphaerica TaxID=252671 RepID=UPI0034D7AB16
MHACIKKHHKEGCVALALVPLNKLGSYFSDGQLRAIRKLVHANGCRSKNKRMYVGKDGKAQMNCIHINKSFMDKEFSSFFENKSAKESGEERSESTNPSNVARRIAFDSEEESDVETPEPPSVKDIVEKMKPKPKRSRQSPKDIIAKTSNQDTKKTLPKKDSTKDQMSPSAKKIQKKT